MLLLFLYLIFHLFSLLSFFLGPVPFILLLLVLNFFPLSFIVIVFSLLILSFFLKSGLSLSPTFLRVPFCHRDSHIILRIIAILDIVIGKVDVHFDLIELGIFSGDDLHYVTSFSSFVSEIIYFLFKIINVFTEDVEPYLINSALIQSIQKI